MQTTRGKLGGVTTALVMLVAMLGALVLPASPAHAAGYWPDQCVETFGGFGPEPVRYDPRLQVEDVNVTVASDQWSMADFYLVHGSWQFQLSDMRVMWQDEWRGHWEITFDNAASQGLETPPSYGGEYPLVRRPVRYLERMPADGDWGVYGESRYGGRIPANNFRVEVTWSDCDPDRDGVANTLEDNCDTVANRDQADRDGDGAGDACDSDNDNDGVADVADNCPLVSNGDQANFDGDGTGDACDGDDDNDGYPDTGDACPRAYGNPCPPPPPTAQPNPTNPTAPPAPGGTTGGTGTTPPPTSAPPPVRRSVVLDVKRRRVLEGAVSSAASACTSRVQVRVLRKQKGRDSVVVKTRAGLRGAFKAKLGKPLRPGRYYARLRAEELPGPILCGSDRSEVVRVRRR